MRWMCVVFAFLLFAPFASAQCVNGQCSASSAPRQVVATRQASACASGNCGSASRSVTRTRIRLFHRR